MFDNVVPLLIEVVL